MLPTVYIRDSLIDLPKSDKMFRLHQQRSDSREEETKRLLQFRLEQFFSKLPIERPGSLLPRPLPMRRGDANNSLGSISSIETVTPIDVSDPLSLAPTPQQPQSPRPKPRIVRSFQPQREKQKCLRNASMTNLPQRCVHSSSQWQLAMATGPLPNLQLPVAQVQSKHLSRNQLNQLQLQFSKRPVGVQANCSATTRAATASPLLAPPCKPIGPRESQSTPSPVSHYRPASCQQPDVRTAPTPKPRCSRLLGSTEAAVYALGSSGGGCRPRRPYQRRRLSASVASTLSSVVQTHPVYRIFRITDVDSVNASLVTRDDRRILKIMGQFGCIASVLEKVVVDGNRIVALVCLAAADKQRFIRCVDRVHNLFPDWELQRQMRCSMVMRDG